MAATPSEPTVVAVTSSTGQVGVSSEKQYEVICDRLVLIGATYGRGTVLPESALPKDQIKGFMELDPPALKELK